MQHSVVTCGVDESIVDRRRVVYPPEGDSAPPHGAAGEVNGKQAAVTLTFRSMRADIGEAVRDRRGGRPDVAAGVDLPEHPAGIDVQGIQMAVDAPHVQRAVIDRGGRPDWP